MDTNLFLGSNGGKKKKREMTVKQRRQIRKRWREKLRTDEGLSAE